MRFLGRKPEQALVPAVRLPLDRLGDLDPHRDGVPLQRARRPAVLELGAARAAVHRVGVRHRPRVRHRAAAGHPPRHGASASATGPIAHADVGAPRDGARSTCSCWARSCSPRFYTGGAHATRGALPVLRLARAARARAVDLDGDRAQRRLGGPACICPRAARDSCGCSTWRARCAFAGVWIEKGMGLIIPGFVPSTLHEVVEYVPERSPSGR